MYLFCGCSWIVNITEKIFPSIQFEYRLITYVDLFVLVGTVITLVTLIPDIVTHNTQKAIAVIMLIFIAISMHDVVIQLHYAYAMKDMYQPDISSVSAPQSFYWKNDYADTTIAVADDEYDKTPSVEVKFDATYNKLDLSGTEIKFSIDSAGNVMANTNISASKYNHLYIDGKKINKEQLLRRSDEEYTYSCIINGKGLHTIKYISYVNSTYDTLRRISSASTIILSILLLISLATAAKLFIYNNINIDNLY